MSQSLNEMFNDLIFANELGSNPRLAYEFSDPDGIRSGKSGYSFAACQFDVQNNSNALLCLKECGFTDAEIQGLVSQTVDVKPLASKLKNNKEIVDRWSEQQLSYCLQKALSFDVEFGIPVESPGGILAGADYVNQYGSQGNGAKAYYLALGRPITALDVLNFKLTNTKYGKEHSADCKRRHDNLLKILSKVEPT